jgi:hypothetical protein
MCRYIPCLYCKIVDIQMQKHRPLGVSIIALLTILGGLAFLFSAFVVLVIIPLFGIFLGGGLFIIGIAYFGSSSTAVAHY